MQNFASSVVNRFQGNMLRKVAGKYVRYKDKDGYDQAKYQPDEGEEERDKNSHYDVTELNPLLNNVFDSIQNSTLSPDTSNRYKKFQTLLKERIKDEDPAVSGKAKEMLKNLNTRWDADWDNYINGIVGMNDTVIPEYNKRRNEILALSDEYKARHATPAWKRYAPWVGGGAALGGLAGAGIGHLAGKHTLLGALLGTGVGAGAGGLGRFLYDKYKDYSGEKRYKELIGKPL